jgi:hypothetical protein
MVLVRAMDEEFTKAAPPEMKLGEIDLGYFQELNGESQQLQAINANLDLQKKQVIDELFKNAENGRKFVMKIQRKFGIQDASKMDINLETGVITLK